MSRQARISIIILAAGASQRLGQPKQLVQYKGQSLIRRAIQSAESISPREILVITGADADAVRADAQKTSAKCVFNPNWSGGMGSSIAMGARSVDRASPGLMIVLCDQWRIQPEDLERLLENWYDDPSQIACSSTGDHCGPPVVFPASCIHELGLLSGDRGAHSVIEEHRDLVRQVVLENAVSDLDTPSQLQQLHEDQDR